MTISFAIFGAVFAVEAGEILSEMQKLSFQDGVEQIWSAGEITSLLQSPGTHAMVVSDHGHPMGFILTRQVAEEAEILTICVLPEYRKKGIARKTLQEFYDRSALNGVKEIFLEVSENNHAAISLYVKNGFEKVGRRQNYYGGRGAEKQDALVMKCTLK